MSCGDDGDEYTNSAEFNGFPLYGEYGSGESGDPLLDEEGYEVQEWNHSAKSSPFLSLGGSGGFAGLPEEQFQMDLESTSVLSQEQLGSRGRLVGWTGPPSWGRVGGNEAGLQDPTRRISQATRKRLRSRSFFITYPQSGLEKAALWDFLKRGSPTRLILAEERHQDGGKHFHATVEYLSRRDVLHSYFDFAGEHPNVQAPSKSKGVNGYDAWLRDHWNYCKKEDPIFLTYGDEPPGEGSRKRKREDTFRAAMELARLTGVPAAMQYLQEQAAYETVMHYNQIYASLTAMRSSGLVQAPARSLESFRFPPVIVGQWRALFFSGATSTGKTSYARALLPEATVVRHRDQLRDCDFTKGVIFDDFDVGHWPPTAVIHLLDWEEPSGIDVKHSHVVIPAGTRKIITSNRQFRDWVPVCATHEQVEAMRRRIQVHVIHTPLY